MPLLVAWYLASLLLPVAARGDEPSPGGSIHLEERLGDAAVTGSVVPDRGVRPLEWTFPADAAAWTPLSYALPAAGEGAVGTPAVEAADGALQVRLAAPEGESTMGLLVTELPGLETGDWSVVEVEMRCQGLRGVALGFNLREEGNSRLLRTGRGSAVDSNGELHTYRLAVQGDGFWPLRGPWNQLALVFFAEEAATVELLSVRLMPGGHDFDDAPVQVSSVDRGRDRRRAIAFHAPGSLAFPVTVPEGGRLDAAIGTLDRDPEVTFGVQVIDAAGATHRLFEAPCANASDWDPCHVDLAAFAGQAVTLVLEGAAEETGAVGLWAAPTVSGTRRDARPNVILYVIDGGGADLMSVYGWEHQTTPNLERLAAEGTVFDEAQTNAAWTKPSTASFMTSLHHSVLGGFTSSSDQIPASAVTMAQHFHRAGYQTAVFTSNPFAGSLSGLHREVDVFRDRGSRDNGRSSEELAAEFWDWRAEWPGEPYWVHFQTTDVHEPHEPVPPFAGMFVSPEDRARFDGWFRGMRRVRGERKDTVLASYESRLKAMGVDPREFFALQRGMYEECMAHNDDQIGRLVAKLKDRGEWERTLLIIAADHGHPAGSFSRFGRGLLEPEPAEWEGALADSYRSRIPLLVFWPGHVPAGLRIKDRVSMIDLLPTVLELAGLPEPEVLQGESLVPLLEGDPDWKPMPVVFEQLQADLQTGEMAGHIELVEGRWAASLEIVPDDLVEAYHKGERPLETSGGHRAARPHRPTTPPLLLYDLWNDPFCTKNVNAEHPDLVAEFTRKLRKEWEAHQVLARTFEAGGVQALDPGQLEALRALGYIR